MVYLVFRDENVALADSFLHVLFVDDDDVDIKNVQREVEKLDFSLQLSIAKSGVEALNKLYGNHGEKKLTPTPQLILLDINMPKMNGIEFLQKLRADPDFQLITVYILTTAFTTKDKKATESLNIAGHIIKPLQYEDLLKIYWSLVGDNF
ncbi:MAG: hypothetical protein A3F10_02865 [Coxiella sp. RIFCSPHIGHO2_12_FULL_42_15]|nr:MAG: hypothetical protein A3F10_02865 [Coxiella sp. RIFCSPHIGHO2_12_FULL_42_15]